MNIYNQEKKGFQLQWAMHQAFYQQAYMRARKDIVVMDHYMALFSFCRKVLGIIFGYRMRVLHWVFEY
jgi:hypothetical protein